MPVQKIMISSEVTNHGSMRMSPKQNNSPSCGSSKTNQIQRKLWVKKSLRSKWRLFHLGIVGRSILSATPQFVCLKSSVKFENRTREDESFSTMTMRALNASSQRLIDCPKRWIDWSTAVQPWLGTQWLLFIPVHQQKNSKSTIFVTRRYGWSVQKPCFWGVSIELEKQPQMMVVHQDILRTVVLKNDKLSNGNVRLHLSTPEICQISNWYEYNISLKSKIVPSRL